MYFFLKGEIMPNNLWNTKKSFDLGIKPKYLIFLPEVRNSITNLTLLHSLHSAVAKTFPENWDSKAPSVGTLLAYLETTA